MVRIIAFVVAFVLSAAYMGYWLKVGWLPQDDGTLAQSAVRVLNGELPCRDFVENYTGGLSYLHAFAFRVFGTNLAALRICVYLFFLAWLPAVFYVASRFTSAVPAAGVTLLAAVWSLPTYPAAMPSWYNLFFAVFGAAAVFRYLETSKARWLFVAGVCGGASILVKVIGLYYVAAVFLFFIFREQHISGSRNEQRTGPVSLYRLFTTTGLLVFLAALLFMMRSRIDGREILHFVLPSAALVVLIAWREFGLSACDGRRFSVLLRMGLPFVAGVLLPVVLFLIPYAYSGSLGAWWHGVFGGAMARVSGLGLLRPQSAKPFLYAIPSLFLIGMASFSKRSDGPLQRVLVTAALGLLLFVPYPTWFSASGMTPLLVTGGAAILIAHPSFADNLSPVRQQQLMLVLALAAVCSIVQFPFAAPIYFCYFAPLTVLATLGVISVRKRPASSYILGSILTFYTLFAVMTLVPARIYQFYALLPLKLPSSVLGLSRGGGLRVDSAGMYEEMVRVVRQHAGNRPLIATPECPEVFFLTGLNNATDNDGGLVAPDLLRTIQTADVNVVVINGGSTFSGSTLTPDAMAAVSKRFPHSVTIGKYWISWRE